MAGSANNVKIDPVNVYWQMETQEQVDYNGITAASLSDTYWILRSAKDATLYHVWHNLDAGGVDPAPASSTPLEVAVTTGDSASTIATAVAAVIDASGDFSSSADASVVTVRRAAIGETTDTEDFDAGVAVTVCRRGKDFDLGLLEGDVELTMSPANFILTSHSFGLTPLAALNQGIETLEVSTVLQETVNSKLKEIYGVYGTNQSFIPAGGSTAVFGAGSSKQGQNLLIDAARLVLRPVNNAAAGVDDKNLMLCIPIPDSLVFSGENPRTLSVTWQGFLDTTIDNRVSAVTFGDSSQL